MKKYTAAKIGIIVLGLGLSLVLAQEIHAQYDSPSVDNSGGGPPRCNANKPKAPVLFEPNHRLLAKAKNAGEVPLQWVKVEGASSYTIVYGLSPRNYIYSALSIGNGSSTSFTVSYLTNRKYYFAVRANNGCMPGPLSNEWWGKPLKGGHRFLAPSFAPIRRQS